jgi:hypothetical protein
MISVFSRGSRFCDTANNYAASFDGVNDYAVRGGIGPIEPNKTIWWSYWIKMNNTTSGAALKWHFGQSVLNNAQEDFIRILYQAANNVNRLQFTFRSSSTSNFTEKVWPLHNNSAITGSLSSNSYWDASNTSINKNSNGYVHLFFYYTGVAFGQPHGFADVDCYWNGQLLAGTKSASGLVTDTSIVQTQHALAINPASFSTTNIPQANFDQFILMSVSGGQSGIFLSNHNIAGYTPAQLANWLYNQGCPRALVADARYQSVWNFENNWDSTPSGLVWTPTNGPTFTTNHA